MIKSQQIVNLDQTRFFEIGLQLKNIETQDNWSEVAASKEYQYVEVHGVK